MGSETDGRTTTGTTERRKKTPLAIINPDNQQAVDVDGWSAKSASDEIRKQIIASEFASKVAKLANQNPTVVMSSDHSESRKSFSQPTLLASHDDHTSALTANESAPSVSGTFQEQMATEHTVPSSSTTASNIRIESERRIEEHKNGGVESMTTDTCNTTHKTDVVNSTMSTGDLGSTSSAETSDAVYEGSTTSVAGTEESGKMVEREDKEVDKAPDTEARRDTSLVTSSESKVITSEALIDVSEGSRDMKVTEKVMNDDRSCV